MAQEKTLHELNGTTTSGRLYSPAIWSKAPWHAIVSGEKNGCFFDFDCRNFPLIGTQTTQIGHGPFKLFAGATGSVAPVGTVNSVIKPGGALAFTLDGNNTASSVAEAYPRFALTGNSSNTGKLYFEASIAVSTILTNTIGFFVGLAETNQLTLSATVPFNAADATSNTGGMIGFSKSEDGLGVVDVSVADRATSFTAIKASTASMTAYTFVRLGMLYNPADSARCLRFFVNNVEDSTALTKTALQAYTYVDAANLGFLMATIGDSSASTNATYLEWVRILQELP